jgi:hypothetical protein
MFPQIIITFQENIRLCQRIGQQGVKTLLTLCISFNVLENRYNDSLTYIDLAENSQSVTNVLWNVQCFGKSYNDSRNHYNDSLLLFFYCLFYIFLLCLYIFIIIIIIHFFVVLYIVQRFRKSLEWFKESLQRFFNICWLVRE